MQFYGCKQVFYFDKSRKVPLGKFPPEKNPPENISDNFVKFWKFFPTGNPFGKFRGKFHEILIIKSIIYRLETSVIPFYTGVIQNVSGNLRETFRKLFCYVTNLSQMKLQGCYTFKKCKFTAVNKVLFQQIPESFPGEISSGEKSPGKYFWQFCQISEIFSDRETFRKISG
jgi:hypothetical protein